MAELTTIARPYAQAAFALAKEDSALPVWSQMLRAAANVASDAQMTDALSNPRLNDEQKESLFLSVCGDQLNQSGRGFMRVLLDAGRVKVLPQISELFDALKDNEDGVAHAHITSALPISDTQLGELTQALNRRFKRRIEADVNIDPALIGGVRVVVGDQVIDASVRGKLDAMAVQLKA